MRYVVLGIVAAACLAGAGCAKSDNAPAKVATQPTVLPPPDGQKTADMPTQNLSAGGQH